MQIKIHANFCKNAAAALRAANKQRIKQQSTNSQNILATRRPRLLLSLSGLLLLRFEAASLSALLFQEPPRITRLACCRIPNLKQCRKISVYASPVYRRDKHDQASLPVAAENRPNGRLVFVDNGEQIFAICG